MGFLSEQIEAPGQPLVELSGQKRVLIENHRGVHGYSQNKIVVNVSYGSVVILGSGMYLQRMTRQQLVICGCIHSICVQGREQL